MSAINRAGLGVMLIAVMVIIGSGLKVESVVGVVCSITALVGLIAFACDRE